MKILAIVNQKGGVAKTTSAINIAAGLQKAGKKVLLIDMDSQANATTGLGIDKRSLQYTVYELMKKYDYVQYNNLKIDDILINKYGFDILPSNIKMAKIDQELGGFPGRENYLKDVISEISGYDYIIIDCPPSLSIHSNNALTAADEVYIPVKADYYSIEGIADLLDSIDRIKKKLNPKLKIGGVFITLANQRTSLFSDTKNDLENYFKKEMMKSYIRLNEDLNKAPGEGKTIFDYKPNSNGAKDYASLVKEIIERSI